MVGQRSGVGGMREFLGFPILIAGVTFGAYAYFPQSLDRFGGLPQAAVSLMDDSLNGAPPAALPTAQSRTFAPRMAVLAPAKAERPAKARKYVETKPAPAAAVETITIAAAARRPVSEMSPISTWQTAVWAGPEARGRQAQPVSSKPGDAAARYELTRDLQRELKRVGCYAGRIDGNWGSGSKTAMFTFMDRVNAALPVDEPDYILLTLLKAHAAASCGPDCPAGQALSDQGRCLPKAILAQAARRATYGVAQQFNRPSKATGEVQIAWTAETTRAPAAVAKSAPPVPLPGRMSVGGPPPESAAPSDGWSVEALPARSSKAATGPATREHPGVRTAAVSEPDAQPVYPAGAAPRERGSSRWASSQDTFDGEPAQIARATGPSLNEGRRAPVAQVDRAPRRSAGSSANARTQYRARARTYARSVQNIFTHPLGRM